MTLHRSGGAVSYPARFQLVLAANPCPCGSVARPECVCPALARRRYGQQLSGPLLDRVDLRVDVDPVPRADLFDPGPSRGAHGRGRRSGWRSARRPRARWTRSGWRINAEVPGRALRYRRWRLPPSAVLEAERHLERGQLSARGFDRVLRWPGRSPTWPAGPSRIRRRCRRGAVLPHRRTSSVGGMTYRRRRRGRDARPGLSEPGGRAGVPGRLGIRRASRPGRGGRRDQGGEVSAAVSSEPQRAAERADPAADLDAAERHGIRLVTPESSDWPHLRVRRARARSARTGCAIRAGAATTPVSRCRRLALWVKGSARSRDRSAFGRSRLVGSRAATAYGEHVTAELGLRPGRARLRRGERWRIRHRRGGPPLRTRGRTGQRSSCRPAASTGPIRAATPSCSIKQLLTGCWCRRARRAARRIGTGS